MQYQIKGSLMQALEITLDKDEQIYTQSGSMAWMSKHMDMKTGGQGGLGGMLKRAVSGEDLLVTKFEAEADGELVAFTTRGLGKIIPIELAEGQSVIAQREAFLCAQDSVKFQVTMTKRLGTVLFGGEGLILQKFSGPGVAWMELSGEVIEYTLAEGEELRVNPGNVALLEPNVDYDIRRQRGLMNLLFSGEDLFLANLKGPGKIWLQTMPIQNLALTLYEFMPKPTARPIDTSDPKDA